jgi:hypothetical protein
VNWSVRTDAAFCIYPRSRPIQAKSKIILAPMGGRPIGAKIGYGRDI